MDEIDCTYESSTSHLAEFTTESDKITQVTRTTSVVLRNSPTTS